MISYTLISVQEMVSSNQEQHVLGGKGFVVHKEQIDIGRIMDEESFVTGRHKVAGFLVGAVANL